MYLNPTFNDAVTLIARNPDTLRIVAIYDCDDFAVADGYEATHDKIFRTFHIDGLSLIWNVRTKEFTCADDDDYLPQLSTYPKLKEWLDDFNNLRKA